MWTNKINSIKGFYNTQILFKMQTREQLLLSDTVLMQEI